jgi:hypothetical protein
MENQQEGSPADYSQSGMLGKDRTGLLTSQPIGAPADVVFQHICQLGLEGIVSKKLDSRYESDRSSLWVKTINPNAPALQRLEQEDWRDRSTLATDGR